MSVFIRRRRLAPLVKLVADFFKVGDPGAEPCPSGHEMRNRSHAALLP